MPDWDGSGPVVSFGRHCGNCRNPFMSNADCVCACHAEMAPVGHTFESDGLETGLRPNISTPPVGAHREAQEGTR